MSDNNKTNANLGAFLTKFSAPVAGIIAFITSLNGFLKLFADRDAGLITIISLVVGILVLFGICLYYARFWKPEKQDKSASGFPLTPNDEQVKAQATKETGRKRVRRAAVAGLVLVPVLTIAGIGGWQYVQTLPTKDVIILVADFEARDAQNYGVNDAIQESLRNATRSYPDTKVKLLGKVIKNTDDKSGSEIARSEGIKQKAVIVIWGWHNKLDDTAQISTNFEILKPPNYLPKLGRDVQGKVQTAAIAELKSFKVQTRLSNQMAYLTLMTLGMSRFAADDWDGAIARLTHALEQVKGDDRDLSQDAVYFYRAYSYAATDDNDRAIIDYTQAIKLRPRNAGAHNNRGIAYAHKGDYNRAIADYTQAIKLRPALAFPYINRGVIYGDRGDYDRAIAYQTKAIQLDPNNATAYQNRGVDYRDKGDYNRAILDFNQAIKLKPDFAAAYHNRGVVYAYKKDYDRAIADYTQAIKIKPDLANAYFDRGLDFFSQKKYDRAIADYTQAIELQPDDSEAYYKRGLAYKDKKDYDKAIADYTQALKLKPDYADVYNIRGTVYRYKGDLERALSDYTQALKLNPDLAESHLWRGVIYSQRGEKQKAMDDLKAALKGLDDPKLKQRAETELRKLGAG